MWPVCFNHLYLLPLGKIGIYYRQGALQNYHTGPGLHTMAPWITKVEQVTIRSQTETMPRYGNTGCGGSFEHIHGLRTPNEGISNLKFWADVADKICFSRT